MDSTFRKGKPSDTQEALRGILDGGYRANGSYTRMAGVGTAMSPKDFKTFGAKAFAGIGTLPGTLEDRCIRITLKRKTRREKVERFRYKDARERAKPIHESLEAWALSAIARLWDANPELPPELDDRAQDGWEPLLAIADLAGGEWPQTCPGGVLEIDENAPVFLENGYASTTFKLI